MWAAHIALKVQRVELRLVSAHWLAIPADQELDLQAPAQSAFRGQAVLGFPFYPPWLTDSTGTGKSSMAMLVPTRLNE